VFSPILHQKINHSAVDIDITSSIPLSVESTDSFHSSADNVDNPEQQLDSPDSIRVRVVKPPKEEAEDKRLPVGIADYCLIIGLANCSSSCSGAEEYLSTSKNGDL
jgi:hypothetical protein